MDRSQLLRGVLDAAVLAIVKRARTATATTSCAACAAAGLTDVGDASVYGTLRRLYARRRADVVRGAVATRARTARYYGHHGARPGTARRGARDLDGVRARRSTRCWRRG